MFKIQWMSVSANKSWKDNYSFLNSFCAEEKKKSIQGSNRNGSLFFYMVVYKRDVLWWQHFRAPFLEPMRPAEVVSSGRRLAEGACHLLPVTLPPPLFFFLLPGFEKEEEKLERKRGTEQKKKGEVEKCEKRDGTGEGLLTITWASGGFALEILWLPSSK